MANELTLTGVLAYSDSEGSEASLDFTEIASTITTKKFVHAKQNIGTAEEAIGLGEVTTPGYALFKNLDPTNFIELRVATGGAKFCKLLPGKSAGPFQLGSGAQVPFALADTAACQMEYLIVSS